MKKSIWQLFSKVEIFKKNLILRPIFRGLCLIGNKSIKVDDYLRKSSLTGPDIFVIVFSHEKEEDYV